MQQIRYDLNCQIKSLAISDSLTYQDPIVWEFRFLCCRNIPLNKSAVNICNSNGFIIYARYPLNLSNKVVQTKKAVLTNDL